MTMRSLFVVCIISFFTYVFGAGWKTLTPAGSYTAREETTLVACGGSNLCLLGGRGKTKTPVLDTTSLTWSNGPAPPKELHHFQGVLGPDGCAWVFSAWTGKFPSEIAVPEIYRYCSEKRKWEIVGKMARPRGSGGAAYHNGYFYVVSGNVGGHQASANTVDWFDRYDPSTKSWETLPGMPHPRDHTYAAILNDKLYVIGGRDSGGANYPEFFELTEKNVDVFSFSSNSWSTLSQNFPHPRAGAPVTVYKGSAFVAGGEGDGRAWKEVDILGGSKFKAGPSMPHSRHGFGMYACNDVIWVAGGAGVQGGGSSQTMLDAYFSGEKPSPCSSLTKTPDEEEKEEGKEGASDGTLVDIPKVPGTSDGSEPSATENAIPSTTYDNPNNSSESIPPASSSDENPTSGSEGSVSDSPISVPIPDSSSSDTPPDPSNTPIPPTSPEDSEESNPIDGSDSSDSSDSMNSTDEGNGSDSISNTVTESSESEGNACFPGHTTVQLHDGSIKTMEDLKIGDKLSERHLLYVNGRLTEAKRVRVGDKLSIAHNKRIAIVSSVERMTSKGLFNPHTLHGDIVVNNIATSTLTRSVHPHVARALLQPFAALYQAIGPHPVTSLLNGYALRALERFVW